MQIALNIALVIVAFFVMELVAWAMHKYVMHGFLWVLHKSHHLPRKRIFEWNDLFFLFFGSIGFYFLYTGISHLDWRLYVGIGISLYGIAYIAVHDIFIHRRLNIFGKQVESKYFRALRKAHKVHHKVMSKEGSESFGMLIVDRKFHDMLQDATTKP